jgi:predicted outer membrane repeat protein
VVLKKIPILQYCLPLVVGLFTFAQAETVVQNLLDSGPGSLREAIDTAEDGNVITFDASLSGGTLPLTGGHLYIRKNITIDGSSLANAIKIDPAGASRIFRISTDRTVTLRFLELANGSESEGGAILNKGPLTLENCTLHHNQAVSMGNGGAIFSIADISLVNCTITLNKSIKNGGAIHMEGGTAELTHCTVTLNGIENLLSSGSTSNLGIGGLSSKSRDANYLLRNTIVAGNYNDRTTDFSTSQNINPGTIIDDPTSVNLIDKDAFLAPLGDYGGGILSVMPLSNSPVIDAGAITGQAIDQRGAPRQYGSATDIGAVEVGSIPEFDISVISNPIVTLEADRKDYSGSPEGLSLREAIIRAKPDSIITFALPLSGKTISLNNGQLELRKNLQIDGTSLKDPVSISGSNHSRVFFVARPAQIAIRSVMIRDGFVEAARLQSDYAGRLGGGILNDGSLILTRCLIQKNSAHSGGGFASRQGSFSEIVECTFDQNEAGFDGGGTFARGQIVIKNSSFVENLAARDGGGWGGGAYIGGKNPNGPEMENCTLFGNSALSGGGVSCSSHHLRGCTIVGNLGTFSDGGIKTHSVNQAFVLESSIVAQNQAPVDPDFIPPRHFISTLNIVGMDPVLGPLQDNGGPTPTMMPLPSSPAIDPEETAISYNFETDQRGHFRTIGQSKDIGAVEANSHSFPERMGSPIVQSTLDSFEPTSTPDLSNLTLREAIAYSSPGATITFSPELHQPQINLTGGEIQIPHSLIIDGSGLPQSLCLDAQSQSRHFRVLAGKELTIRNLKISNGRISRESTDPFPRENDLIDEELVGGALIVLGSLIVENCHFNRCTSNYHGGAIAALGAVSIFNSSFSECVAEQKGGAFWGYSKNENISIHGTRFEENRCGDLEIPAHNAVGGAVSVTLPTTELRIDESYFINNQANKGGALSIVSSTCNISQSTFLKNSATNGFAIESDPNSHGSLISAVLNLSNSTFSRNHSLKNFSNGDSIIISSTLAELIHCTISDIPERSRVGISNPGLATLTNTIISHASLITEPSLNPASSGNYIGPAPMLSPLGHFGGLWPTMVPLRNSPVLDLGSPTGLSTDQRGFQRISGAGPDAGAIERRTAANEITEINNPIVSRSDDPDLWDGDLSTLSLRQALILAKDGSQITFEPNLTPRSISLNNSPLEVTRSVMIGASIGKAPIKLTLDEEKPVINILPEGSLSLTNIIIDQHISTNSPILRVSGELFLDHCQLLKNSTNLPLVWVNGTVEAIDCHFSDNQCRGSAGVFTLFPGASGKFNRCSFIKNTGRSGGAIAASTSAAPSSLIISSSTFQGNTALTGGAIDSGAPTDIRHSTIVENHATSEGGGLFARSSSLTISNSVIALNESPISPQISSLEPVTGTNFLAGNPLLLPPGHYGGPAITMLPLASSPLLDNGTNPTESLDQRGLPRSAGDAVDLGAVEYQGPRSEFLLTFHLDSDRDGMSNGLEIATGRNPFLAGDPPSIDLKILPDGQISTGFDSMSADSIIFKITRSHNLHDFESVVISNEFTPLSPEGGFLLFEDPASFPKSFYRVEVSPR